MTYRKFSSDLLFTGTEWVSGSPVLVSKGDGTIVDIIGRQDAGDGVEHMPGLLCPGFINCHCHLELSHLGSQFAEKTGLPDFVVSVMTRRHDTRETIAAAIRAAEEEMLEEGIVGVGDVCNNASTAPQKKLGRMAYYNFVEVSGWAPQVASSRFAAAKSVYDEFFEAADGGNPVAMAPHAPYSVSKDLWRMITPFFRGRTTTMHNQETRAEDDLFRNGGGDFLRMYERMNIDHRFFRPTGMSSLRSTFPGLAGAGQVLLVHNTFTTEEDLQETVLKRESAFPVYLCLCINANLFIEDALPPVELFRSLGCNLVLGTDSLASNHRLSILEEIKTLRLRFPHIPLGDMLQWATFNGARALGMEKAAGSFERGKKPGIILVENLQDRDISRKSTARKLL